jgi:hypothetical protein
MDYRADFSTKPIVLTYPYNAYSLGVVMPIPALARRVICENFIQIVSSTEWITRSQAMYFSPLLTLESLAEAGMGVSSVFSPASGGELMQALIAAIRQGYVVRLRIDEYHLPDRKAYHQRRRPHECLVVAIDRNGSAVELVGYCSDGRYRSSTCPASTICKAHFAIPNTPGRTRFLAFKANPEIPKEPRIDQIRTRLDSFLAGRLSGTQVILQDKVLPPPGQTHTVWFKSKTAEGKYAIGLKCYEMVEEYLSANAEIPVQIDRIIFSLLAEHAITMRVRAESLLEGYAGIDGAMVARLLQEVCSLAGKNKLLSLIDGRSKDISLRQSMAKNCAKARGLMEQSVVFLLRTIDQMEPKEALPHN